MSPCALRPKRAPGGHRPLSGLLLALACAGVTLRALAPAWAAAHRTAASRVLSHDMRLAGSALPRGVRLLYAAPSARVLARARFQELEGETDKEKRDKLAYEMLEGTPVSQMAGGMGKEGANSLYVGLGVFFLLLCALTAAVVSGAV
mmetsp:Transcript_79441/g.233461  ORF Transcript_79441/g.233461 Transcript_79441/m.233461 type:complete len:147 (-) Transcript_79441:15-455(-)